MQISEKSKRIITWSLVALLCALALVLIILFSYQQVYAGRIYKNVYFGTVDLSGKSQKEARKILQERFKSLTDQEFAITAGQKTVKAKLVDTGLSFDSDEIINRLYTTGRGQNFWENIKGSGKTLVHRIVIEGRPTINQTAFDNFATITVKQLNDVAIDASLAVKDGAVSEVPSHDGQTVQTENLIDRIITMVADGSRSISLERTIQPAKVQSSDFTEAIATATQYLSKKITFSYAGTAYTPSATEIGVWIYFANKDGKYSAGLEQSNIKAYLNRVASNFEVSKKDKKVEGSGNILQEGRDGIYLDKDTAVKQLMGQIANDAVALELTTYKEVYKEITITIVNGAETGRFPGKYIDVNLSTETLCRLEGSTLIDCFMTSTGKPSTPTPTGSFTIIRKNPMGWAPNPGVHMPWFMEFKAGGYGFHELVVWPNGTHEVVEHLGQPVSHGCVRTGPGVAEMLFNWADIGSTSVYIHW